jgi:hypothetical protein
MMVSFGIVDDPNLCDPLSKSPAPHGSLPNEPAQLQISGNRPKPGI